MYFQGINVGEILTQLLIVVLPIVFLFLAREAKNAYVVGVAEANKLVWAKLSAAQQEMIMNAVHMGVLFAEQVVQRQDVKDYAEAKREAAYNFVNQHLAQFGITINAETIYGMIEAAVKEVFNFDKLPAPAPAEPVATPAAT